MEAINKDNFEHVGMYITHESRFTCTLDLLDVSEKDREGIANPNYYVYVLMEFIYLSLVTERLGTYIVFIKLKPFKKSHYPNNTYYQIMHNENEKLEDTAQIYKAFSIKGHG